MKVFKRSLIVVIVLTITGVLSYKAAMMFWQPSEDQTGITDELHTVTADTVKASEKGVSKNLIYCYDKKAKEITKIVLEILNSNDNKLTYITIPVRTECTLPNALYEKLTLDAPEMPQVLKLSTLTKYLSVKKAYADGAKIIGELLETNINYYTAIPKNIYETIFQEKSIKQDKDYDAVPQEVFTNEYKTLVSSLDSKNKVSDYMEEMYPKLKSNLSLKKKKTLAKSYSEISASSITFDLIKGTNLNNGYVIDESLALEQLSGYLGDTE